MRVSIVTIFPEFFPQALDQGMVRIAREKGVLDVRIVNLRDFTEDKHRTTDDAPFGGGVGMVMLPGVVVGAALAAVRTGQFAWKPVPGFTGVKLFAGGLVMGAGALLADGCNVTQGLTNSATLAAGSLTAFGAMLLGGWATLWLLFGRR